MTKGSKISENTKSKLVSKFQNATSPICTILKYLNLFCKSTFFDV